MSAAARRAGAPGALRGARLKVDMIACDGRGLCAEVLPEVVTLDDWGFPIVTSRVPARLGDQAQKAVRLCPRLALRLERDR
ncbi:MAG: ferredoxin [Streptosporangiaceae bacterium]